MTRPIEHTPSAARVEETIRVLGVGWWEAMQMRNYYRWARLVGRTNPSGFWWGIGLTLALGFALWAVWQGSKLLGYLMGW